MNQAKIIFPSSENKLNIKIQGVFGTPEDWKVTDQANPGLFSYTVRFFKSEVQKGKIYPRELTEKQLREQEDKNKKGAKKEAKKQENPGEEERLKKQQEQLQKRKQEDWNQLSEEEKYYKQFEDPFQSAQLRFEKNSSEVALSGKQFIILNERITVDNGEWIYFYKYPTVSEDELAKMRKAKPKTLNNINDLNPITLRSWVDLSKFNSKTEKEVTLRCKLVQVDKTADTPEPNLEKSYIKININFDKAFLSEVDSQKSNDLIADPARAEVISGKISCVSELKNEIKLAIESLAMEYSGMFWKELNLYEDLKDSQFFINKKNQINKRKEHFLYDFNISGKYKILKDRIKKTIVHLCENKYAEAMNGSKSFTGISCTIKDQFYSEIYNFLVITYKQTLKELTFEKMENLGQNQVLSPTTQEQKVQKYLQSYVEESQAQRIQRISEEYNALQNFEYSQQIYTSFITKNPKNVEIKYQYSMYCLKNQLKSASEVLPFIQQFLSWNKSENVAKFEYLLLLIGSESEQNIQKSWVFLRQIMEENPAQGKYLMLAEFVLDQYLKKKSLSCMYLSLAERVSLRQLAKIPQLGKHRECPVELPSLKASVQFAESMTAQTKDSLYLELISLFFKYNLLNVVAKLQARLSTNTHTVLKVFNLKALLSSKQNQAFFAAAKAEYEATNSFQYLEIIVRYLISINDQSQLENYLKIALVKSQDQKDKLNSLLRLSHYYLLNQKYANSKACILKYLEKKKVNSGLSWRILGICELRLNNYDEAIQCLRHSNLLDINNGETWLYFIEVFVNQDELVQANQSLNQYEALLKGNRAKDADAFKRITQSIRSRNAADFYAQKVQGRLLERLVQNG